LVRCGGGLRGIVRRAADHHLVANHPAGPTDGQVILAQVQHLGTSGQRDVGPVVHRQQRPVAPAGVGEYLQGCQFGTRIQGLVPQLDDVHAAGQRRVDELGKIPTCGPRIRTQVQPRIAQPRPNCLPVHPRHPIHLLARCLGTHGSICTFQPGVQGLWMLVHLKRAKRRGTVGNGPHGSLGRTGLRGGHGDPDRRT
jgi:hypothetical protein